MNIYPQTTLEPVSSTYEEIASAGLVACVSHQTALWRQLSANSCLVGGLPFLLCN